ncbi:MAG TPA: MFS transporter [bacterium]|nr:MFS transporter [bacterium]
MNAHAARNDPGDTNTLPWPAGIAAGRALVYRLTFFFLPLFLIEHGRTGWEIGALMSLFALTTLLLAMPFGVFNDRMESRRLVMAGFVGLTVFYLGLGWAGEGWTLILIFLLGGLGASITQVSLESLVLKSARPEKRGGHFGIYSSVTTLVFAVAVVAGGWLLETFRFQAVFRASAAGCVALALLSLRLGRSREVRSPISTYRSDTSERGKRIFIVILFFFAFHWGAEVTSYTPFLRERFGYDLKATGLYMGTALAALAGASFLGGRYSDRLLSIRGLMGWGFVLSGAAQILMIFPPPGLSLAFRVAHEIGDGLIMVLIFFWASKVFHVDRLSGNYGVLTFALLAGQTVSSLIFGPVGAAWGYDAPLWMSGAVILLCFAALRRFRHEIFAGV